MVQNLTANSANNFDNSGKVKSKQLKYYYKHRPEIKLRRKNRYDNSKKTHLKAITNNSNTNFLNNIEKSNVIKNPKDTPTVWSENKENSRVLSLFDLVCYGQNTLHPERMSTNHALTKTTFFVLPSIVQSILFSEEATFSEIYAAMELSSKENKLSNRQLRRRLQLLVNLKWLIKRDVFYYPNPFLVELWNKNKKFTFNLVESARLKIDFFHLLNIPLLNAKNSNQQILKTEVKFKNYQRTSEWHHAFFEGQVNITMVAENGDVYSTCLPVNFHASSGLDGYCKVNKYKFPHHTIPLSWSLFDVSEGKVYTKKGRTSRWSKNIEDYEYIHFDNSIKILCYPTRAQRLLFRDPFIHSLKKWNTKTCQYVEVSSFKLLDELFHYRFVKNLRRSQLFEALDLSYKPISGRPKKCKNENNYKK